MSKFHVAKGLMDIYGQVLAGGFLADGCWVGGVGFGVGGIDDRVAGALALRFCRKGKGDEQGD